MLLLTIDQPLQYHLTSCRSNQPYVVVSSTHSNALFTIHFNFKDFAFFCFICDAWPSLARQGALLRRQTTRRGWTHKCTPPYYANRTIMFSTILTEKILADNNTVHFFVIHISRQIFLRAFEGGRDRGPVEVRWQPGPALKLRKLDRP